MRSLFISFTIMLLFPAYAVAEEQTVFPSSVYAVALGDLDGNGIEDAAILIEPNDNTYDDFGLYLYLREADYRPLTLHTSAPNFVWGSRAMAGQMPTLTINDRGSLIVKSENIAIGRNKWEQKLTIAFRDEQFLIAGYTYSFYDGLDPENYGSCDVNLLTGKGVREMGGTKSVLSLGPQRIPASEWGGGSQRDICSFFDN